MDIINKKDNTKALWTAINSKVPWVIFAFAIALVLGGIGWSLTGVATVGNRANVAIEKTANNEVSIRGVEVKQETQFAEVLRSLSGIRKQIEKL